MASAHEKDTTQGSRHLRAGKTQSQHRSAWTSSSACLHSRYRDPHPPGTTFYQPGWQPDDRYCRCHSQPDTGPGSRWSSPPKDYANWCRKRWSQQWAYHPGQLSTPFSGSHRQTVDQSGPGPPSHASLSSVNCASLAALAKPDGECTLERYDDSYEHIFIFSPGQCNSRKYTETAAFQCAEGCDRTELEYLQYLSARHPVPSK